jgi:hypothetical protein
LAKLGSLAAPLMLTVLAPSECAAVTKLMAKDDGRDLSDLLQELLERWVKE